MSSRKGISPIIAAVLLVAVSLGVVGVFSGWAPGLIQTLTESTTNNTEHRIDCDRASLEIMSATSDGSTADVAVRNRGRIDLGNVSVVAFYDNTLEAQTSKSINQGQVVSYSLSVSNNPDEIEAVSKECGSVTDTTDEIN